MVKVSDLENLPRIRTGEHFQTGNWAVSEGALAAGLTNYYGYPITPSSEIAEFLSVRLPGVGGSFWQLEDEIASIIACIGSSWAGGRSMTATSGPGFSLMMEGLGLGTITETPLVIVNSMRVGPSTGMPTSPAQGDFMQSRFGSHGDFTVPALAPSTVQECFNFTVRAFSIAEIARTPVIILLDQVLSSINERVNIPSKENVATLVYDRKMARGKFPEDLVIPMKPFGCGDHVFGTGLTHNERGTPELSEKTHQALINRIFKKVKKTQKLLPGPEFIDCEDAETIIITYGSQARPAHEAVLRARDQGISAGLIRLRTCWPFPIETISNILKSTKVIIVPEMSLGQLIWPVKFYYDGPASIIHLPKIGGKIVGATEIFLALGGSLA